MVAEKKYHSSKLELLGFKWATCDHFCDYLYMQNILMYTQMLTPSLTSKPLINSMREVRDE